MKTADLDSQIKELKSAWQAHETENDTILSSAPMEKGILMIDNDRREAFQKNLAKMQEIKGTLNLLETQKSLSEWGAAPSADSISVAAAAGARAAATQLRGKSVGELFVASDEFKHFMSHGGNSGGSMNSPFQINGVDLGSQAKWLPGVEGKDVYTASPSGGPTYGFAPVMRDAIIERPHRRMRVRDLFNVQQTSSAVIEYFRSTGFVSNGASTVAERTSGVFTAAPQTELTFVGAQAIVRTISHWEAVHRNTLADVPQLQGVIDNELLYGLRLREDDQILNGRGIGEDLPGIMRDADAQTYAHGSGDNKADDIRRAATKSILAYYEPTGVVMHPNDWEDIELLKDDQGAYLLAVAVAVGAEQRLWRLPVVDTPAMTEGSFLVGAFGLGAQLYDRQEGSIRVAEQHADFFIRNGVVVLADQRLALAIKRPESFVKGTF